MISILLLIKKVTIFIGMVYCIHYFHNDWNKIRKLLISSCFFNCTFTIPFDENLMVWKDIFKPLDNLLFIWIKIYERNFMITNWLIFKLSHERIFFYEPATSKHDHFPTFIKREVIPSLSSTVINSVLTSVLKYSLTRYSSNLFILSKSQVL